MDLLTLDMFLPTYWININLYPLVLLCIFLAWSLLKRHRSELIEYLDSFNIVSLCLGILVGVFSFIDLWDIAYFSGESGDAYRIGVLNYPWWGFFILRLCMFLGLLKKKLRRSFTYSLGLSLVIGAEVLIILITSLHADFLPSTFSLNFGDLLSFFLYGLTALVLYLIQGKWSRGG